MSLPPPIAGPFDDVPRQPPVARTPDASRDQRLPAPGSGIPDDVAQQAQSRMMPPELFAGLSDGLLEENSAVWFDELRVLRAEVQDLRAVLATVRRGGVPLSHYTEYIKLSRGQIEQLVRELAGDDCITRIKNAWEQIKTCPAIKDPAREMNAQEELQHLSLLDAQCRQMIFWASYRTIPHRLNTWLAQSQPGYAIPFHAVFEDEVEEAEDRQKILNAIAWSPGIIAGGIVDPVSGLVYLYSQSLARRLASLVVLLVLLALATGAVYLAGMLPPLSVNESTMATLLIGWGALLVGTAVHIGVALAKRLRSRDASSAGLPLNRLLHLIDARLGQIVLKLMMALVGFLAFVYVGGLGDEARLKTFLLNAFLVGYSLDSFLDLFGANMDQRSTALRANLTRQLDMRTPAD